jgi:hypothetical protein
LPVAHAIRASSASIRCARLLATPAASIHGSALLSATSVALVLAGIRLAIGRGISARRAAVLFCRRPVRVGCTAAMLRVVLPVVPATTSWPSVDVIAVEIVVAV